MIRWIRRVGSLVLSLVALLPAGCWNSYGLADEERAALMKGEKAIVLLRIDCTIDGRSYEPFDINRQLVMLELGSFETGGEPKYTRYGYLSEESCRSGWAYLVLSPGLYYLTVLGPKSDVLYTVGSLNADEYLKAAPRWRLDVPEYAGLIYVGTLRLQGTVKGTLLFGEKLINPANGDEIAVIDEHKLAEQLVAKHFPEARAMKTVLMQRWHPGEPIIIRTPVSNSSR